MSEARRRRLTPDERRTELIDAAMRVLRDQPALSNHVAEVTREAGSAKGTFYVYFPSWDDMLAAIRERLFAEYNQPLEQALELDFPLDWPAFLASECRRFIDFLIDLGGLHEAAFHAPGLRPVADNSAATTLLAQLIQRGIDAGALRAIDAQATAALLLAAAHEAADRVASGEDPERWYTATRAITDGWLRETS